MIGLRRVAFRVLSTPSKSTPCRSRAFNTATAFTARSRLQPLPIARLQRRFASEEAQTQSEPSADRSEEGQYGDNSIAASSQESHLSTEGETSGEAQSSSESQSPEEVRASETEQPRTVGELASAAADATKEAASTAFSSIGSSTREAGLGGRRRNNADASYDRPPAPPSPTVYVGNLFFDVREDDIRQEFEKIGPIENVKLITDNRGLSKGFGYITFATQDAADAAIAALNDQPFEGRRITVQYATYRSAPRSTHPGRSITPNSPSRTLFIGNMAFDMSDRELNNLFREIRNVIDVRVAIDRRTGQPRGFAHADFTDIDAAKEAMVALAGKEVCGRTLRVDYSQGSGRVGRRDDGADKEQGY